jgi:hypothetical protein
MEIGKKTELKHNKQHYIIEEKLQRKAFLTRAIEDE